jgi:hypothetical protein
MMHSAASGIFFLSLDGETTVAVPALPALTDEVEDGIIGDKGWKLEGASG